MIQWVGNPSIFRFGSISKVNTPVFFIKDYIFKQCSMMDSMIYIWFCMSIKIYNLNGQLISTLSEGYMNAASYTMTWDASQQVSGMYLVRAETAGFVSTQKLLLIK